MNTKQMLAKIPAYDNNLKKLNDQLVNRMLGQLRRDFSKLNSISKNEIANLYKYSNTSPDDFKDIIKEYPGGGYVMSDPLYTLITLIALKAHIELDDRGSQNASMLLSLVMFARLKYKYIRICDPNIIKLSFSLMSKKTYIGTGGLVWGIYKISSDTFNKYKDLMKKDPNNMYYRYRYIIDIRNKFNQLMKHIAQMYYWVIINKHNIYTKEKITSIVDSILNYICTKEVDSNILTLISKLAMEDITAVYELQHQLQINDRMQNIVSQIFFNLIEKFIAIKKFDKSQHTEIDFTSIDFLKEFYTNSRRSSILLNIARNDEFSNNGFSSNLVLAFSTSMIVMWESVNKIDSNINNTDNSNDNIDQSFDSNINYNDYNESGIDIYDYNLDTINENFTEFLNLMEADI